MKDAEQPQTVPMSVPGWDPAKPAESFRAFAALIHGEARQVLLRDGHHAEMFFVMPLSGDGHIVLWQSNDRDLEAQWLRRHVAEHYAYGVVHVVEAWTKFADGPRDHVFRQVLDGEIKVSQLKPEHRGEALMVSAQSRDGWATSWTDEILRDHAGTPHLGRCVEITDFRGRFGKVFG